MNADPGLFLSTIILASAGLVAIVGGLLVARFVGMDTDERTNRRVLVDAAERLASADRRAFDAQRNLDAWQARSFLADDDVRAAIARGVSDLDGLRKLEDCPLGDETLGSFVSEVVEEFSRARQVLADYVPEPDEDWEEFRRTASALPEIRRPWVWQRVFGEIVLEHEEEIARKRAEQREAARRSMPFGGVFDIPLMPPPIHFPTRTDYGVTNARRYDELVSLFHPDPGHRTAQMISWSWGRGVKGGPARWRGGLWCGGGRI